MKKLLVPVDFSETSRNAYHFSLQLAAGVEASIDMVNVNIGSMHAVEPARHDPARSKKEALTDQLIEFKLDVPQTELFRKVEVHTEAISGFTVVGKINDLSKNYDLIVMGTKGEHDLTERILGTVSSGVAQHAKCPVLLVPAHASFRPFHRMLYAMNWESVDEELIKEITDLATKFSARIDFIHINQDYELEDFAKVEEDLIQHLFEKQVPKVSFSVKNIKHQSPLEGINNYARDHEMDLIVIVNRQRNFLTNLLGKSMTKELGLRTSLPILVYHYYPKL